MSYYNYRDLSGKFTKAVKQLNIVPGRLYDWRGIIVRAGMPCNGGRYVTSHKTLSGFVKDEELKFIPKSKVNQYLKHA